MIDLTSMDNGVVHYSDWYCISHLDRFILFAIQTTVGVEDLHRSRKKIEISIRNGRESCLEHGRVQTHPPNPEDKEGMFSDNLGMRARILNCLGKKHNRRVTGTAYLNLTVPIGEELSILIQKQNGKRCKNAYRQGSTQHHGCQEETMSSDSSVKFHFSDH
ncbi:hypothetical protein CMV_018049 [Castanea mollissima]|uniref:Uncharacterized protein n=1 Tax=Castanea mollissima TaxID=60419 RepID=A0A8J4QWB5_9ROSI|nr:hypothetical protein CMV_018049 [Castanea mollissima]